MSVELPQKSWVLVGATAVSIGSALYLTVNNPHFGLLVFVALFFASGFFADLLTALFHFGFDYVFPYSMPILGPISREFREHHNHPTLDPSNYGVNLTKGSYAALPLSLVAMFMLGGSSGGFVAYFVGATIAFMSVWAIFFHQIHAYAHMGSHLHPEAFNARVAEIAALPSKTDQIEQFDRLFDNVPIPRFIRLLQKSRILLNPAVHNLHHIAFESDFSSVNGWSDPVTNGFFRRLAAYYQAKDGVQQQASAPRN